MGENKVFLNATIPEYQGDLCLFLKKKTQTGHTFNGEIQQEELTT